MTVLKNFKRVTFFLRKFFPKALASVSANMGRKKIYTERNMHVNMAQIEVMKFIFSIIVLGLAAAVVHNFKGIVQIAAACCLSIAVVCMGSSVVGILLFDANRRTALRVLGGIVTMLWMLASASIIYAALYSNGNYLAKRWLLPRKGGGGRGSGGKGKGNVSAAGDLSSISWVCFVFCLANWFGCLVQWYYDYRSRHVKKNQDPERVLLDSGKPR